MDGLSRTTFPSSRSFIRDSRWNALSQSKDFVLFSNKVDALGAGSEPVVNLANGERLALVVLTPACDIQHCYAKRLLFLAGIAKPSELLLHRKQDALITPILIHNGTHYVVEWELGAPVSWVPSDFAKQLQARVFERVRRFRALFSLQLQQRFASNLSRVGTPVMPPMQHLAGVTTSAAVGWQRRRQQSA